MSPSWPLEMLATVTFAEEAGKTKLTLRWAPINPTAEERKTFNAGRESMKMGWTGTFEQLDAYLCDPEKRDKIRIDRNESNRQPS